MKYCSIWANLFIVVLGKTSHREGYEKEKENKTLNTLLHVQLIRVCTKRGVGHGVGHGLPYGLPYGPPYGLPVVDVFLKLGSSLL